MEGNPAIMRCRPSQWQTERSLTRGPAREVEKGSSPPDVGHPATGRLILEDDVQGVDDTREITKDGEQDVDQEISSAAALQEDT
jgi:hypothetical protein